MATDIYLPHVAPERATSTYGLADPGAFGAVGRAIANVGEGLEHVDAAVRQRDRDYELLDAAKRSAQIGADIDDYARQAEEAAAPGAPIRDQVLQHFDKMRDEALGGIGDERVRRRFDLQYAEMRARLQARTGATDAGRRAAKGVSDFTEAMRLNAGRLRVSGGDAGTFGEVMHASESMLDALDIPEENKAKLKPMLGQAAAAWAEGMPAEKRLALLRGGYLNQYLDPDQLDALIKGAEVDLRRDEVEQRRDLALAKADAVSRINLAEKVVTDGGSLPADQWATLKGLAQQYDLPGEAYDLAKLQLKSNLNRVYGDALPAQIDARIKTLDAEIAKQGDHVSPELTIERDQLTQLLGQRTSEMKNDPQSLWARSGHSITPVNWADPATIQARDREMRAMQAATGSYRFLSDEEAEQVRTLAASGPNGRLQAINMVAAIGRFNPRGAVAAAGEVAPNDKVFARAVTLPAPYRSAAVLGAEARKVIKVQDADHDSQAVFNDLVGGALSGLGPDFTIGTLETARNIYAELMRSSGASADTPFSDTVFTRAVNMALGGTGSGGGIGQWRGAPVVLPSGIDQAEFERRLSRADGKAMVAAAGGKAPHWRGGPPMKVSELKAFKPVAVGNGLYRFESGGAVLRDADGDVWVLDVRKLGR